MNLKGLYASTPVERHGGIVVARDRVYVRTAEGTDEYAVVFDGELVLVRSDPSTGSGQALAAIRQDLAAIMAKLGL